MKGKTREASKSKRPSDKSDSIIDPILGFEIGNETIGIYIANYSNNIYFDFNQSSFRYYHFGNGCFNFKYFSSIINSSSETRVETRNRSIWFILDSMGIESNRIQLHFRSRLDYSIRFDWCWMFFGWWMSIIDISSMLNSNIFCLLKLRSLDKAKWMGIVFELSV